MPIIKREWHTRKKKYNQYNEWLRNRQAERAELERKFGYDCKHGMHLMRLLRMGKEVLSTGQPAIM